MKPPLATFGMAEKPGEYAVLISAQDLALGLVIKARVSACPVCPDPLPWEAESRSQMACFLSWADRASRISSPHGVRPQALARYRALLKLQNIDARLFGVKVRHGASGWVIVISYG